MPEIIIQTEATRNQVIDVVHQIIPTAMRATPLANTMMRACGNAVLARIRRAFLVKLGGGTDECGTRWQPIKPSTAARKGNRDILRDKGPLLASLSPGSGSVAQVLRPAPGSVTIGSALPYARFHHEGTRRMPQRRLWAETRKWSVGWWQSLVEPAQAGLVKIAVKLVEDLKW